VQEASFINKKWQANGGRPLDGEGMMGQQVTMYQQTNTYMVVDMER
jgi:hypothetical protein